VIFLYKSTHDKHFVFCLLNYFTYINSLVFCLLNYFTYINSLGLRGSFSNESSSGLGAAHDTMQSHKVILLFNDPVCEGLTSHNHRALYESVLMNYTVVPHLQLRLTLISLCFGSQRCVKMSNSH